MIIKNQRGVALVVALMITVIIGVIAITLASVTSRTQRSDNSNYGRVLGTSNAVSGVNRAMNFLGATADVKRTEREVLFDKNHAPANQWTIGGNNVVTTNFFRGLGATIPDSKLDANNNPWYRDDEEWTDNCPKCVSLNNGTTTYYIEERDEKCAGLDCQNDPNSKVRYVYYRITSRGFDNAANQRSAAVVQTHVKVRKQDY